MLRRFTVSRKVDISLERLDGLQAKGFGSQALVPARLCQGLLDSGTLKRLDRFVQGRVVSMPCMSGAVLARG